MNVAVQRPTPDEDHTMRRLHFFESWGNTLSDGNRQRKQEIRARDLRHTIRQPVDHDLYFAAWTP